MIRKTFLGFLVVSLVVSFLGGCSKKQNPLGPNMPLLDQVRPTPTAVAPTQGKSTVVVKTIFGNAPLSNVACKIQFEGQPEMPGSTDSMGTSTFLADSEGNFTATIPGQVDVVESSLVGYVKKGDVNTVIFQGGGAISVTPTAIQYDFAGGTFPINIKYENSANALRHKINLSLANIPAGWSHVFTGTMLEEGQSTTLNITVPGGSTENVLNLSVIGSALSGAIQVPSRNFAVYKDWFEYGDIRVTINNGNVGMSGINLIVTDSVGQTYTAQTQSNGVQTVRVWHTGNYTVNVPAQGYISNNSINGVIQQAQLADALFQVGSADIDVTIMHNNTAYQSLPFRVIDSNGVTYNASTGAQGNKTVHINSVGNYTVEIIENITEGIRSTIKTGSVNQNQNASATFNGAAGSFELTNVDYLYPYLSTNHTVNVTYRNTGGINYFLSMGNPGFPGGCGITWSFDNSSINKNQTRYLNLSAQQGNNWSKTDLQIPGTKGGQHTISINSGNINVSRNWSVWPEITTNPVVTSLSGSPPWNLTGTITYYVRGNNVPAGTTVSMLVVRNMPNGVCYQGGISISNASNLLVLNSSNSSVLSALNRTWTPPYNNWYYDGTMTVIATLGTVVGMQTVNLDKY